MASTKLGVIFTNKTIELSTGSKVFRGELEITDDMLAELVKMKDAGITKVDITAWQNVAKSGVKYLSLTTRTAEDAIKYAKPQEPREAQTEQRPQQADEQQVDPDGLPF